MKPREQKELAGAIQHAVAEEAGRMASACGAKCLMMVHMFDQYVGREEILIGEAQATYDGPIIVPEPLKPYSLPTPAED